MRYPIATGVLGGFIGGVVVTTALGERWWESDVAHVVGSLPAPLATIVTGVLGAAILAWQAREALKNIITGQNHRAQIEQNGRRDQDLLERQRLLDDREYERKVLAAALYGELTALLKSVHNVGQTLMMQQTIWEAMTNSDASSAEIIVPTYRVPLYEANINRLGILGPSVAADVATVFARATTIVPTERPKVKPRMAAGIAKALHAAGEDWGWDIVQVSSRLAAIQFGNEDPGSIADADAKSKFRAAAMAKYGSSSSTTPQSGGN